MPLLFSKGSSLSTYGELHPCNVTPCAAFPHRRLDSSCYSITFNPAGLMTQTQLSDGLGNFAMVAIDPAGPLLVALRAGRLQCRDVAILWALVATVDWRSGRSWSSITEMAAATGRSWHSTQQSLGRLRKEAVLARGIDKRDARRYWCINPGVAATGGKHRRAMQWQQFQRALE